MSRTYTLTLVFLLAVLAPLTAIGANRHTSYDALASASDKIVLGTVGVKSSNWGEEFRIYTDIIVTPDVTIKGADEGAIVVRTMGGTIGDVTMSVSDGPEFPDGERVIVFLKRESDHFVVVGRSGGSIRTSSSEAANAMEGAFMHVERRAGSRLNGKRGLAASYLRSGASSAAPSTATAAAQVGCYSVDGKKWAAPSATYKIGDSIPLDWAASIDASAATWTNAGAAFRLVNDSTSPNELSYVDLVAKYGSPYANTFAVTITWTSTSTGFIVMTVTEINTKWQWSTSAQPAMADLQNIITHEFGHWMRLLDIYSPSACSEVTMWGSATFGETKKRTLEQADVDGFVSLYGLRIPAVGTPILTVPANGASGVATAPGLVWNAASNATSYDVYVGTTPSPALVATVAGTAFQPGTLTAGVTYYWRVVAKNASGSATSNTFSFTVASAIVPTLLAPADGATAVALVPVMQWSAVPGATSYDVYIGPTASPLFIGSLAGTIVNVRGFQPGSQYYWQIIAHTPSGTVSSAVASFRLATN